jgi:phosphoserine phosphatase
MYVLTFVAEETIEDNAIRTLHPICEINWIIPEKVARVPISKPLPLDEIKLLRQKLEPLRTDVFCTPLDLNPKLFLADMDSTIVTSETLDELAAEAGIKEKIAAITERAMRGELDFRAALQERVGLLKDLTEGSLKRTLSTTVVSDGGEELLTTLKRNNVYSVLVSGGFTFFTSAIASKLGFNQNHGNILGVHEGKLTGLVEEPILDKEAKLAFLQQYVQTLSIDIGDTIAIGDGANDLPMLSAAGLGIGYKPKPLVEDSILNCIRHTDLRSVAYMVGMAIK